MGTILRIGIPLIVACWTYFNVALVTDQLPRSWKYVKVLRLFLAWTISWSEAKSYRPVSLLSELNLGWVIFLRVTEEIRPAQSGFQYALKFLALKYMAMVRNSELSSSFMVNFSP